METSRAAPVPDPIDAPNSYTARKPNASDITSFELPHPPWPSQYQKYPDATSCVDSSLSTKLASVGNLLTPASTSRKTLGSETRTKSLRLCPPANASQTTLGSDANTKSLQLRPPASASQTTLGPHTNTKALRLGRGITAPSPNPIVQAKTFPTASEVPPLPHILAQQASSSVLLSASELLDLPQAVSTPIIGGLPQHVQHQYGNAWPTSNRRPFKCGECPQSFNRQHDLSRHKRIHSAAKPFPCGNCDKSFSRKDALKVRQAPR